MESVQDKFWLSGDPIWWGKPEQPPPDFRPGEISPPIPWISTTPSKGNFGWCRQRMRPLVRSLLLPFAWAPFFLILSLIPIVFPGKTQNDQFFSIIFLFVACSLVFFPLLFSRNSQPMSEGTLMSLPIDWITIFIAIAIFPMHLYLDPRLGWFSYLLVWASYLRTIEQVQDVMLIPPSRFILPISPLDWDGEIGDMWEIESHKWASKKLARAPISNGELVISGITRSGCRFLSLAFIHKTGFVQDPFHDRLWQDSEISKFLRQPIPINGLEWPIELLQIPDDE